MRSKLIIIISLTYIFFVANALIFNETINVNGDGELLAETDAGDAHDLASGSGNQKYVRSFDYKSNSSTLMSSYQIDNSSPGKLNRYMIGLSSEGRKLAHVISIEGYEKYGYINSTSSIKSSDQGVNTGYDIEAQNGTLSESIVQWTEMNRPNDLASTSIKGEFDLRSKLAENQKLYASDFEFIVGKVVVTPEEKTPIKCSDFEDDSDKLECIKKKCSKSYVEGSGQWCNCVIKANCSIQFSESNNQTEIKNCEQKSNCSAFLPNDIAPGNSGNNEEKCSKYPVRSEEWYRCIWS